MTSRVYSCILKKPAAGTAENNSSTLITKISVIIIKYLYININKYYNTSIIILPK